VINNFRHKKNENETASAALIQGDQIEEKSEVMVSTHVLQSPAGNSGTIPQIAVKKIMDNASRDTLTGKSSIGS